MIVWIARLACLTDILDRRFPVRAAVANIPLAHIHFVREHVAADAAAVGIEDAVNLEVGPRINEYALFVVGIVNQSVRKLVWFPSLRQF